MTIARHVALKRSSKPKRKNVKRAEQAWFRAFHSKERVEFVAALPCIVPGCGRTPCENHHVVNGGGGRRADYDKIVPLCSPACSEVRFGVTVIREGHHAQLHRFGKRSFESLHGISLAECAAQTEARWQSHLAPDPDDAFSMASAEEMGESHTPGDDRDDYDVPNGAEQ